MSANATPSSDLISVEGLYKAKVRIKGVAEHTPLMFNHNLSEQFGCKLLLKREDLQVVRSYKIRGAYNKMAGMGKEALSKGVVCASAGNHAQGVAFACHKLRVNGKIFMPEVTPKQKVNKVKLFGKEHVDIVLVGDTFDEANALALKEAEIHDMVFVPPFDDRKIIEGQGTVGLEILEDCHEMIDYLFLPIGGGGLISGVGSCFKQLSPDTKIIGVEPAGAPAMKKSIEAGKNIILDKIDSFVDGAAVKEVGKYTLAITTKVADDIILVPEGKVCNTILHLYNEEGIVVEPAGALTIAALDYYADKIKGKNVVCVLSGSNNDITRTQEIRERSLFYEGLKHYFVIKFPQRAGALRDFLNDVLGPTDDITHFEYTQKHNRETGPALVGIRVQKKEDYDDLIARMKAHQINYQTLNDQKMLFDLLV
jgi:threonine dehydratase